MNFDQLPLLQSSIIIRPDLTLAVIWGDDVVEFHLSPEEAFEIADALTEVAMAAKVAAIFKPTPHANANTPCTDSPGTALS